MSRYQAIENGLKAINEAVFQELCDKFLALKNRNYSAFSRTGSQSGKLKTIKGTPDSFFLLPNGNYIYVETTTNVSDDEKLANDIEACFNTEKTEIPIEKIEEIVLCFNFNIDQEQIEELRRSALEFKKDISISFWSLDALSIELHLQHRDLVYEYLNLPLDTGQIVSIESFIAEYNKVANGIATPLDNDFVHRESEKEKLKQAILHSDYVILTGAPGVGKTRLAIETIVEFLNENDKYSAYCISYKSHTLLDDLYQYFDKEKDYILFVDDANRIDAFNQITGFYRSIRTGKLKIVITVRNYAFQEIDVLCQEYNPKRIDIDKLTDEQITDIIKAKPFEILNRRYQSVIIRIADGNPRLAIMASLLAKAKQDLYALSDVSDLFEIYFSTFVKDQGEFANNFNIKCLGIIAFFNTLPYRNKKKQLSLILDDFGIAYSDFIDAIDRLDKLELVEIQYEHVSIPEQNLSTYFFYKSFIKESLLSFQVLLNKHFDNYANRFKDCVIPTNNTFGSQNVKDKLKPELQEYWKTIETDQLKAYNFLSTFWFYLQSETLGFVYNEIDALPASDVVEYDVFYKNNAFSSSYNKNKTIELLGELFRFSQNLKDAIELALEYTRRLPVHLPELIHKIRERLKFDRDDERISFSRQTILFDLFIQGLGNGDRLYKAAFFELAKTFLSHNFDHFKGGRNSFYLETYPIHNTRPIQEFRAMIWIAVDNFFDKDPSKSLKLLNSYLAIRPNINKEILEFDIQFIIKIIDNHLSASSFEHCRYVQNQIRQCKRNKVLEPVFPKYLKTFTSPIYEMFLKIDWDRLRDKEIHDFDDFREYERLKEVEIRSSFIFSNQEELQLFYKDFVFLFLEKGAKDDQQYHKSLEYVIDENCTKNFDMGYQLLELIIEKNNETNYVPRIVFSNHLNTKDIAAKIWKLVQSRSFQHKTQWELSFYDFIDGSLINDEHPGAIVKSINETEESITINFDRLARYLRVDSKLFHNILRVIVEKNDKGGIILYTWKDLFSVHFDKLGDDIELIKKAYLQLNLIQKYLDYEGKGFLNILKKDPSFLIDFIHSLNSENGTRLADDDKDMSFIWEVKGIEVQLIQVFDIVIQKEPYYGIIEHFCNAFFRNLQDQPKNRADKFLMGYVTDNFNDPQKMNVIVDIVRHSRKELFDSVLLHYISLNQDPENFSKICWKGNSSIDSNEYKEASDWKNILSIVEKSGLGIKLIPIKKYLNDEIEFSMKRYA